MQYQLKPISPESIPEALQKAERYRLLNEPYEAQSICEDILRVDPNNQDALVMLALSITDQFGESGSVAAARQVVPRLQSEYHRAYYGGIIFERSARAHMRSRLPGSGYNAYEDLTEAMRLFEKAEGLRPAGNDDAILRWNTCARMLMSDRSLQPRAAESFQEVLGE
jgi:hypothetical protein